MKEKAVIYGLGSFFHQNEKSIDEKYEIVAYMDQYKTGGYNNKEIMSPDSIVELGDGFEKIIVMIRSIHENIKVIKKLKNGGVDSRLIMVGIGEYGIYAEYFPSIEASEEGNLLLHTYRGITLEVCSEAEFNNVYEVWAKEVYEYLINNGKKDVVLDVGMNIGDSVLYFLQNPKVQKVYAYEPFHDTFIAAEKNIRRNVKNMERIELFQYGISDREEERWINFNTGMTTGQSTRSDIRDITFKRYLAAGLLDESTELMEKIKVMKASDIVRQIKDRHCGSNIILKMDCEGEEYGIIKDLSEKGMLGEIDFIMMEWHYEGKGNLIKRLSENGFSYCASNKNNMMGLINAWKI